MVDIDFYQSQDFFQNVLLRKLIFLKYYNFLKCTDLLQLQLAC